MEDKNFFKILIEGDIILKTGLHIGGSEVELDIGGIDSEVITIKEGKKRIPYIPGSSLRGKLRNLIAKHEGYQTINDDKGHMLKLFGHSMKGKHKLKKPSRLQVRDSHIYENQDFFLEDKAENTIDRVTGKAMPRHIQRVTKGAKFIIDMVLDIYPEDSHTDLLNTLRLGFNLLKMDYLGGHGTRGYGKVDLEGLKWKEVNFDKEGKVIPSDWKPLNLS